MNDELLEEYDFSDSMPNPFINRKKTKKQITINIDNSTIAYFKNQASETGIPYQSLINLYLSDCAVQQKKLKTIWT